MSTFGEGCILGAGNALLDCIVRVDKAFLDRWGLKENDSTPCSVQLEGIFEEIEKLDPEFIPGGTVQNTALVFQWIIQRPNTFTVLGTVGEDSEGQLLLWKMASNGVNVNYEKTSTASTGKCAVMLNGQNRSMCTQLGASRLLFSEILNIPRVWSLVEQARYFYFSSQLFNASAEFLHRIARHSHENEKIFCLNLGSPLAQKRFREEINQLFPFVDVVFGNDEEVSAFGEAHNLDGTVSDVALSMTRMKKISKRERIIVTTRAQDTVLVTFRGECSYFETASIPEDEILDTSGAGDAFVGGFLSQFVQEKDLQSCVKCGIYAASEIIKQFGCCPPKKCSWTEK